MTTSGDPIGGLGIAAAETVGAGLARIGCGQFDRVADGLAGHPDRDTGLHEARKAIKRLRALLRLVRRQLGEPVFEEHDGALRDLARALAPLRDARVSIDILDEAATARCPGLRTVLAGRYQALLGATFGDPAALASLERAVGEGRRRWEAVFPGALPDGFEVVAAGITRTYRRGRKRMARAMRRGRDRDFHEWRKEAKHLRHQMEMLLPLDPVALAPAVVRLVELGEVLGSEHDLTVVIGMVDPSEGGGDGRSSLLGALSQRRAGLRAAARRLGTEVFGSEPAVLVAGLERVWAAARPAEGAD
ncbi:MAG: CHAD domain-containing protein [Actinobacteria bacterium]|nr:CHAD domain-containing protein [Actinomycetota bacterium]